MRSAHKATEVAVPAYELFASTELLEAMALQRMMAKLSTRRYGAGLEPVGTAVDRTARSTTSLGTVEHAQNGSGGVEAPLSQARPAGL